MAQLYLTFFAIGLLVFAAIAGYSWLQKSEWRKQRNESKRHRKEQYDDPIFVDDKSTIDPKSEDANTAQAPTLPSIDNQAEQTNADKALGNGDSEFDLVDDTKKAILKQTDSNHMSLPVREMTDENDSALVADFDVDESNANNESVDEELDESAEQQEPTEVSETADNVEIINAQPKRDKRSSSIVTELVARVNNTEAIEQKDLLTLFRNHDFKFHRQVHIYGLNQLTDLWRDIEFELPSARFVELGVAIQLADRDGAMTNKELHDFQQMALEFSNQFDAPFEFSMDIDEALTQAKVLDQVGRRYDSMAVLNVVPRAKTGFRVADIESCARDLEMTRSKNGIFLKTSGQKKQISILYRLACTDSSGDFGLSSGNTEPIHDLVIYMNVPATNTPETVFQNMVEDANSLATWLDGKVVDKDGKVMTQRSYAVLTQQISDISFSMQQDGLIPGDSVCKKLF